MPSFAKDPAAVLDYAVDWTPWLQEGETITASAWDVPAGITADAFPASHTDTAATVWLSGGTLGVRYYVVNHIATSAGREDERSIIIRVTDR